MIRVIRSRCGSVRVGMIVLLSSNTPQFIRKVFPTQKSTDESLTHDDDAEYKIKSNVETDDDAEYKIRKQVQRGDRR